MAVRARALVAGVWLAASLPLVARPDVMPPEEEDGGFQIDASITITGAAGFPDHVFFLYPVYCTTALARLDDPGAHLLWHDQDEFADRPQYLEVSEAALPSWIPPSSPCESSTIYALARDVAAAVDLKAMSLEALDAFFEGDDRLFKSDFEFIAKPTYVPRGSQLRQIDEVLRIVAITGEGIKVVLDSSTYSFADGTFQTLPLAHTRRPSFPYRPLKPEKVAKYEASFTKWQERQPAVRPSAPRFPDGYEEPGEAAPGDAAPGEAAPGDAAPVEAAPVEAAPVEAAPVEAAPVEVAPTKVEVAPARPEAAPVPPSVAAAPPPAPATPPAPPVDEEAPPAPARVDAWPLGALAAALVALVAGVLLARRRAA